MSLPDKRNYTLDDLGQIFEFDPRQWVHLGQPTRTLKEKQDQINAFKEFIRKRYRKLVMKHHPDKGGDQRDFQVLQRVYETVQAMKVRPIRQPHYVRVYTGGTSSYWSNGTNTTSTGYW